MDRIDLHVEVTPVSFDEISSRRKQESSADIRLRVIEARNRQTSRFAGHPEVHSNALMPPEMVKEICEIGEAGRLLLLLRPLLHRSGMITRIFFTAIQPIRSIR